MPKLLNPVTVNKVDVGFQLKESRDAAGAWRITLDGDDTRVLRTINSKNPRDIVDACHLLLGIRAGDSVKLEFTDGTTRVIEAKTVDKPATK